MSQLTVRNISRAWVTSRQEVPDQVKRRLSRALLYVPLIAWAAITAYPFYWMVITSFRTQSELYSSPFGLPTEWHWQNYLDAWETAHIREYALNSFLVVVMSTALVIAVSSATAFVFSRFNFRFKSFLWAYVLLGLLVPEATRLVPLAILSRQLGLYDNLVGLALVYAAAGVPFNTFLLTSFMQTIPRELEEAAVMDGATMWQVFRSVILPLSQPALATSATFHALYSWNEYIIAVLLIASEANRTLPMGMKNILGEFKSNFPGYAAGMVIVLIPALVFFLVLQRYIVKGISAAALRDA